MKADNRNTVVVVSLILAMTAGARVLLWLEPEFTQSRALDPLTAADGVPVEEVLISFALPGQIDLAQADCLVWPDGQCDWQERGTHVWMVVLGSDDPEAPLAEMQKRNTLKALGSMTQVRGWNLVPVRLDVGSDVRRDAALPRQAAELCELLVSRGIVE